MRSLIQKIRKIQNIALESLETNNMRIKGIGFFH